jgi:hypothetical protein
MNKSDIQKRIDKLNKDRSELVSSSNMYGDGDIESYGQSADVQPYIDKIDKELAELEKQMKGSSRRRTHKRRSHRKRTRRHRR